MKYNLDLANPLEKSTGYKGLAILDKLSKLY